RWWLAGHPVAPPALTAGLSRRRAWVSVSRCPAELLLASGWSFGLATVNCRVGLHPVLSFVMVFVAAVNVPWQFGSPPPVAVLPAMSRFRPVGAPPASMKIPPPPAAPAGVVALVTVCGVIGPVVGAVPRP